MGDTGGASIRSKVKGRAQEDDESEEEVWDTEDDDDTIARIQRAHYAQAAAMNPRRRAPPRPKPMSNKRKLEAVKNFHDFTKKLKKDTGISIRSLVGNNILELSDFSSEGSESDSDGLSEEEFVVNPDAVQELDEENESYIDPETGDILECKSTKKPVVAENLEANPEVKQEVMEPKTLSISDIINEGDIDLSKNVEIAEVETSELCSEKCPDELLNIKQEEANKEFEMETCDNINNKEVQSDKSSAEDGASVENEQKPDADEEKKASNVNALNVRRNIREVMDEKNLDASTLAAQRQESERLARVQEQQRIIREVQRQIAINRQNKIHQKTLSLLQGGSSLLKRAGAGQKLNLPNTVLVKLPSGETKKTTLKQGQVEVTKVPKPTTSGSVFQKIGRPDQRSDKKEVVEIVDSSSGEESSSSSSDSDDCIMLSDSEVPPSPEAEEDPANSGLHVNDAYNIPDEQGRVLINIGHPENEEDIFLAPQIARIIKPHQIGGVRFLFDNIIESVERFSTSSGFGCILAHSMGLGKTLQIVSFCDIFLRHTTSKTVLCIMPINTLQNWVAEFNMWLPLDAVTSPIAAYGEVRPRNFPIYVLNDSHKTLQMRAKVVKDWTSTGGVLMIGYELYRLLSMKKDKKPRKKKKAELKAEAEREKEKEALKDKTDLNEDTQGSESTMSKPSDDSRLEKDDGESQSKTDPEVKEEKKEDTPSDEEKKLLDEMYAALVRPGPDLVICDEGHRIKNSHSNISYALKQMRTKRRVVLTGYPLQNNLLEYWCMVDFVRPNYLGSKTEFCNMFERPIQNGQCIDSTPQDIRLMRYRAHVLHSLLVGFVQRRSHAVLQSTLPQKEEYVLLVRMTPLQRKLYDRFMNEVVRSTSVPNPLKAFAICCKIWNHPDVLYNFLKKRSEVNAAIEEDLDLEEIGGVTKAGRKAKGSSKKPAKPRGSKKPAATIPPNTSGPGNRPETGFGNTQFSPSGSYGPSGPPGGPNPYPYPDYHNSGPGYYPSNQPFNQEFNSNYYPQQQSQQQQPQYGNNYQNQYPQNTSNCNQGYNQNYWNNSNFYGNTGYFNNSQYPSTQQQPDFSNNPSTNFDNQQTYPSNFNAMESNTPGSFAGTQVPQNTSGSYTGTQVPQNTPGSYTGTQVPQNTPGSYTGTQVPQNTPGSYTGTQVPQNTPGSYTGTQVPQNAPGSYTGTQISQNTPGSYTGTQVPQNTPGSYTGTQVPQNTPGSYTGTQVPQNTPGSYTGTPVPQNTPGSYTGTQVPQNTPGSYTGTQVPHNTSGSYTGTQVPQNTPGSYTGTQGPPNTPGSYTGTQVPQNTPGSYTGNQVTQNTPGSYTGTQVPQNMPGSYTGTQVPQNTPGSYTGTQVPQNTTGSYTGTPVPQNTPGSYTGTQVPQNTTGSYTGTPVPQNTPGSYTGTQVPQNTTGSYTGTPVSQNTPGSYVGSQVPQYSSNPENFTNQLRPPFQGPLNETSSSGYQPFNSNTTSVSNSYPNNQTPQDYSSTSFRAQTFAGNNPAYGTNLSSTYNQYDNQNPNFGTYNSSLQSSTQNNPIPNQTPVKTEVNMDPNYRSIERKTDSAFPQNNPVSFENSFNFHQQNPLYPEQSNNSSNGNYSCSFPNFPSPLETKPPMDSSSGSPVTSWPLTDTIKTEVDKIKNEEKAAIKSESDGEVKIEDLDTKKIVKDEVKRETPNLSTMLNNQSVENSSKEPSTKEQSKSDKSESDLENSKKPKQKGRGKESKKPGPKGRPKAKGRKDRKTSKDKNEESESEKSEKEEKISKEEELAIFKKAEEMTYDWATDLLKDYVPGIIENSAKMELFFYLLNESIKIGDRILLFSQSLFTLNLIEDFLEKNFIPGTNCYWQRNTSYYRLDGSTHALEREKLINEFNANPNIYLFLVSTRAGSLGINLVGANRVIVFDASWNPCHDTQAVCRVYRYGQRKPCFVYRFVMDWCLEKKIYDRQINKQGMADRVVDECNPDAVLSMKEITNLCFDNDEKESEPQDLTEHKDKYVDLLMQGILNHHGKLLSKEPFQHESLLVDRKEKKLSSAEKRLAQRGYELEKKAASAPKPATYRAVRADGSIVQRPVASVRPMQHGARWIPADVWRRQGMTAQEMTLPLDVVIPTNSAEKTNIVLKAGQRVMVLKSPKGIYMQLESGKIIAIKTSLKGLQKGSEGKEGTPVGKKVLGSRPSTANIPGSLKNNSAITITSKGGPRPGIHRVISRPSLMGVNKIPRPVFPGQKIADIRNRLSDMRAYQMRTKMPISPRLLRPNLPGSVSITKIPRDLKRPTKILSSEVKKMELESEEDTQILDSDDEDEVQKKDTKVQRPDDLKPDNVESDVQNPSTANDTDKDSSENEQKNDEPMVLTTDEKLPPEEALETKSVEENSTESPEATNNQTKLTNTEMSNPIPTEKPINLLKNYRHQRPCSRPQSESSLTQLERTASTLNTEGIPDFRRNLDDITQSYSPGTDDRAVAKSKKKKSPVKNETPPESQSVDKTAFSNSNMSHSVSSLLGPTSQKSRMPEPNLSNHLPKPRMSETVAQNLSHAGPRTGNPLAMPHENAMSPLHDFSIGHSLDHAKHQTLGPSLGNIGLMSGGSTVAPNIDARKVPGALGDLPPVSALHPSPLTPGPTYPANNPPPEGPFAPYPGYGMGYGAYPNAAYYAGYGGGYYPPYAPPTTTPSVQPPDYLPNQQW